ncbi:hypothetical protein EVA_08872, partial [gut metagenome]
MSTDDTGEEGYETLLALPPAHHFKLSPIR